MDDSQKARENWERYCYARDNGHIDFLRKDERCREFFYGQQWREEDVRRLKDRRPALTINKVFSTLATIMGEQILAKADIMFQPGIGGEQETADALSKLWLHISYNNNLDALEEQVFDSGAICSRGFYDVRMDFRDHLRGDVSISYLSPRSVVIDCDATSYDPDDWGELFITRWMSPLDIENTYNNAEIAKELEGREGSRLAYGFDSIDTIAYSFGGRSSSFGNPAWGGSPDYKLRRLSRVIDRQYATMETKPHFVDVQTGDMRVVPPTWDRERIGAVQQRFGLEVISQKVKVLRWTVSVDDMILHDAYSPYKHFTVVPFFPFFHEGRTIGFVENSIGMQELLNKSISQELHVINTTANSGWQMEAGQLINMDEEDLEARGAETGLVLVRKQGTLPLEKIQPNQVPTGIDRLSYKADEFMKELFGISDSQRGFDRADVAAKAIKYKQQAGHVNLVKAFQNLTYTRRLLAERVLDLVQQFYTGERMFHIFGNSETGRQSQQLEVNQVDEATGRIINDLTLGEYAVVVVNVPSRDTFEDKVFDEAVRLRTEVGIPIPDEFILEHSHLHRKHEIIKSMQDSPEAQALRELGIKLKQLELQEKEAEIMKIKADAALSLAKAQAEAAGDADGAGAAAKAAEMQAQEMQLRAAEKLSDARLRRMEMEENNKLKREEMIANIAIKREEMQAKMKLERVKAVMEARTKPPQNEVKTNG